MPVPGRWAASNDPIVQTYCNPNAIGRWAYIYEGNSSEFCVVINGVNRCTYEVYQIKNLGSGMCMATKNSVVNRGTAVVQELCGNTNSDWWLQFAV